MDRLDLGGTRLAQQISAMSDTEICHYIRSESRSRRLSRTLRTLNRDVLSADLERRRRAEAAIRKLGFI